MIKIDGSYLEGGGQIVRTALALSTLTQRPFEAYGIRKGRKEPGLKNQHLYCIKSLKKLCGAVTEGDDLGSTFLKYYPKKINSRNLEVDVGTAGSITLVLQSILIPSIFSSKPVTISLTGGTDVSWSMSFDYFNNVILPQLQRFAKVEARLLKRGYYPKGNGKVEIKINPKFKINNFPNFFELQKNLADTSSKINLIEQCTMIQIKGISHASRNLETARVAERQAHSAQLILGKKYNVPIKISSEYQDTMSTGSGITLWAIFSKNEDDIDETNPIRIGVDTLGEHGKKSEIVGEEVATNLIKEIESKTPVDKHLADQLLPFMALAGNSKIRTSELTDHCRTNIYVIEQFLGKIFIVDEETKTIRIS